MTDNPLLQRLDGFDLRFEEVKTFITDPSVIADQKRYVRLTKEYHDLEKILNTAEKYKMLLAGIEEAKKVIASEDDEELREMAREEFERDSAMIPDVEMEIKMLLVPADPEDAKNAVVEIRGAPEAMRRRFLRGIFSGCIRNLPNAGGGSWRSLIIMRELPEDIRRYVSLSRARMSMV